MATKENRLFSSNQTCVTSVSPNNSPSNNNNTYNVHLNMQNHQPIGYQIASKINIDKDPHHFMPSYRIQTSTSADHVVIPYKENHEAYSVSYMGEPPIGIPTVLPNSLNSSKKFCQIQGTCFVLSVLFFIGFEYTGYVSTILLPYIYHNPTPYSILYAVIFHILVILLVLSFIQTSRTNPGNVPSYWGFRIGDDCKRRRYCKICHVWKPDRTHHCSTCGRCILHMDHHCPWVNNCIGFDNRKFFIQLLCYGIICDLIIMIHGTYFMIQEGSHIFNHSTLQGDYISCIKNTLYFGVLIITILFSTMLGLLLIPFTKFHLVMVARNSSTIENMDIHCNNKDKYDIGTLRNMQQVLGTHFLYWCIPCNLNNSRPTCDGVRWTQQYWKAIDEA